MIWMHSQRRRREPIRGTDELERYLNEPLVYDTPKKKLNIMAWWRELQGRFPLLARMAFDTFSVPAMSSETERVFSSLKHVITSERASLSLEVIEATECVKHWMKAELYTDEELTAMLVLDEEIGIQKD